MIKITVFLLSAFSIFFCNAQTPVGIQWQRCLGGFSNDFSYCVKNTSDGGYILVGQTQSNNGDVTGNNGGDDIWVVKTGATGNIQWQKCLGGTGQDPLGIFWGENSGSIQQTNDGGYILVGNTLSNDGNVTGNHGGRDIWVVKLNSTGVIEWQKCYGGTGDEYSGNILQTADNGYIFTGSTTSNNVNVIGNHGGSDGWVVKIDNAGNITWQKCLGGTNDDVISKINIGNNGGYICAGYSSSNNGNVSGNHGGNDGWVVKIDNAGNITWQKCIGGSLDDFLSSDIQNSIDGGYIITGTTESNNGDVSGNHGQRDLWLIKLSSNGNLLLQKCLGGSAADLGSAIIPLSDGGYILTGSTESNDGDVFGNHGGYDLWVIKTNSSGILLWQRCLGGNGTSNNIFGLYFDEVGSSIIPTTDGGYIVAGYTFSYDGNVIGNHGNAGNVSSDAWLMKLVECNSTTNSSSTINITSCTDYTTPTGQVLINSGTYVEVIPNHIGCDSTITINYTRYYPSATNSVIVNTCTLPYTWNGQSYNSYGSYSQTLQTINGCDSVVYLELSYFSIWDNNICIVGLDQTTGKNKVVWEKDITQVISGYKVYRENFQTGFFDLIGSTNYSDSSLFLDVTANPIQQAYRYQITYTDTCGNESSAGSPHKTMHLTINQGVGTTWNLIWTPYLGIGYPSYNIYRGTNASNMTLLTTVASNITSYTDANAPGGFVYYQIEIVSPTNCNPTKSNYNNSRSNVSTNDPSYLGVNEDVISAISIYPNPASNQITIAYAGQIQKVEIMDAKGAKVYSSNENKKEILLPSSMQSGYYLVLVHTQEVVFRKELMVNK